MANAKILVIDDDPRMRRFLELNLESEGYACHQRSHLAAQASSCC